MANEDTDRPDNSITGRVTIERDRENDLATTVTVSGDAASVLRQAAGGPTRVQLDRSATNPTSDQPLWVAIRNRTRAISFDRYNKFINEFLCEAPITSSSGSERERSEPDSNGLRSREDYGSPTIRARRVNLDGRPTIQGTDAYKLLKVATESFLIFESGVFIRDDGFLEIQGELFDKAEESRRLGRDITIEDITADLANYLGEPGILPYLDRIVRKIVSFRQELREERLPYCEAMLQHRLTCPSLIELIWSYWHEEGMLAQTMNALAMRFQNRRLGANDPLANLELDPLRPLNNLIWGFVQDEYNRLSLQRRAYEYDHHYGFTLVGRALGDFHPADSRSKFLEAFHNLLYRTMMFYREDDDTTVVADAFAMLNALREVHIVLAEGAHNQYGDLPWTARKEMLMMQWMLARPEIREFIRGRYMVPYQEQWMGAVDDMKRLQGWTDVTITHFHELAIYGEQILLSVRFGDWIDINDQELARNWARYWRPEIQRFIHAYHAVTGVDLSSEITNTRAAADRYLQPSVHLSKRLAAQTRRSLPPVRSSGKLAELPDDHFDRPMPGRKRLLSRNDKN